jgi:hypothetical protein
VTFNDPKKSLKSSFYKDQVHGGKKKARNGDAAGFLIWW